MDAISFIAQFKIFSREGKVQPASKSEVRRWIESGAVRINGEKLEIEKIDFPIISLVLFPNGNKTITLK